MMEASNQSRNFQSWGRYPALQSQVVPLHWTSDFPLKMAENKQLPVGFGHSYGDVCLLEGGTLLQTTGMDRLLHFDPSSGVLRCEAGVSLARILEFAVEKGFFLPVTPGTKYVTVGGAIANDVHGKNHHVAGTFGCHVLQFELVRSDGTRLICSHQNNKEWFSATIGGMGLTGLITWAEIQLRRISSRLIRYQTKQFHGMREFLDLSAQSNSEYAVAWLDCVSTGRNFARGVFIQGDHDLTNGPLIRSRQAKLRLPFDLPEGVLNRSTVRMFNSLYFHKQRKPIRNGTTDFEPFFYPLDAVLDWNRMYGKSGLLQFQCVLPPEDHDSGILEILRDITASGLASFLAVLKVFGSVPSPGMISFPTPGITLALDFPIRRDVTFKLIDRLATITAAHGGRMYSAKDARMTADQFQAAYPQWEEFAKYVDPEIDSGLWQRVTGRI